MTTETSAETTARDGLARAADGFDRAARVAQGAIASRLFGTAAPVVVIAERYRLEAQLGVGGQGSVWRAYDLQLARAVAIKTVHLAAASPRAQAWLRREARTLGRLTHPGIVAVYDLGVCPSVYFGADDERVAMYCVMELVEGDTLAGWLAAAHRSADEILAVMRAVADALAAVHAAGLVHCDVKPSNILVAGTRVKLADFGLAHAARRMAAALEHVDVAVDASTLAASDEGATTSGPGGGTLRYMAPEQMSGARVDARADEFAFAATLFEALYGHGPHGGRSVDAWLAAKLQGAPPQPGATLSAAAYRALARSLAGNPQGRHGNPRALIDAIDRARGRTRTRWALVAASSLVLAAVGLGGQRTCPVPEPALLGSPLQRDVGAALIDEGVPGVADRVLTRMRAHDAAVVAAHEHACAATSTAVTACLAKVDGSTRAIAHVLADELDDRRRVLAVLARLPDPHACARGDADPSLEGPAIALDDRAALDAWAELVAARALDDAGDPAAALARLSALDPATIGPVAYDVGITRGGLLRALGRYDEAGAAFDAVWQAADGAGDDLAAARAAIGLAMIHGVHGHQHEEGQRWVRHGRSHAERGQLPAAVLADLANVEGSVRFVSGHHVEAREVLARGLADAAGLPPARTRALRENLATTRALMGDRAALEDFARLLEETIEVYGEAHPSAVRIRSNLATAQLRFGEREAARANFEQVLQLRDGAFGAESVENARVLSQLADIDAAAGDVVAALARLAQANELRARFLPTDHPERADGILHGIELMLDGGDVAGAAAMLASHRDAIASSFGLDHPIGQDLAEIEGRVAEARGDARAAAAAYGDALAGLVAIGRDDSDLAGVALATARNRVAAGDRSGAADAVAIAARGQASLDAAQLAELAALQRDAGQ